MGDPGAHEKKRGQEGRASFKTGKKRNRAAVYGRRVCTLHQAPREGICEVDMEPTLHSQNRVPGKGLDLPEGRTLTDRGQRGMAL